MHRLRFSLLVLPILQALAAEPQLIVSAGSTVLAGESAGISANGLRAGERVRLHAFRAQIIQVREADKYVSKPVVFHAWADFAANARGTIKVESQVPVSGSYTGADALGLFWSGYPEDSGSAPSTPGGVPLAAMLKGRTIRFELERDGAIVASQDITLRLWNDDVVFARVDTPRVVGYFAAPKGASKLPVVIILHGSEGGLFEAAKRDAGLYASHGFAALSLIYFSWSNANMPQVPPAFDNLPLERVAYAREWLAARPEADVNRLGLRGASKGSEFALLAAAQYPWVKAVAACVPSSLVWGAFGTNVADGKTHSGFSFEGKPLPNIPYGDYAPVEAGKMTLADRHRLDRKLASPDAVRAASIPLEKSSARFLLSGSGEDDVWPSLEMSQESAARLVAAGKSSSVETQLFPHAGHYVCGTGEYPSRSPTGGATPGGGDAAATGQAGGQVWRKTLAFLQSSLR